MSEHTKYPIDVTVEPVIIEVVGGVATPVYVPPFVRLYILDIDEKEELGFNDDDIQAEIDDILKSHGVEDAE